LGKFRLLKKSYNLLIVIALSLTACVTDYYFEVDQVSNKELFPKPKQIGSHTEEISFYNKMNWGNSGYMPSGSIFFPNDSSSVWFNIGFLHEPNYSYRYITKALGYDNYLISFIQFHPKITNVKSVIINPIYNGSKLNCKGVYVFNNNELIPFSPNMLNKNNDLTIYYIFDYPISALKRFFIKKTSWFPEKVIEKITITNEVDGEIKKKIFQFDLKWRYHSYWIT
jgi:hypothetical protein